MSYVLSADLGGTKTLLRLSLMKGSRVIEQETEHFSSHAFDTLEDMINPFIQGKQVRAACLAVAGPVVDHITRQAAEITNLPWLLDSRTLAKNTGIPRVTLINDFQAIGYGIHLIDDKHRVHIQHTHSEARGVRAIIGAGTGLGQAFMVHNGHSYQIFPTEGGHTDFAPGNAEEVELLKFLQQKYGRVSYERLLSGNGLLNIYHWLQQAYPQRRDSTLEKEMESQNPTAIISNQGMKNPDSLAGKALSIFVRIYGAQAGNMALNYLCTGGLYIAGGIAGKIESAINSDLFRQAFNDKGRMSHITHNTPVMLITDPAIGLLGAEYLARQM